MGQRRSSAECTTNVGVRMYGARALAIECEKARQLWWDDATGWNVPGNDPAGHEFALDNVDAELSSGRLARIAWIAKPEELSPVKSVDDIPAFERAMETVLKGK